MVRQSVSLRALLAAVTLAAAAAPAAAQPGTTTVVVDLAHGKPETRAEERAKAMAAVLSTPILEATSDPELAAALSGELIPAAERRGREAAASAERLAAAGKCADAAPAARSASLDLAAAQAIGIDVAADLTRAQVVLLRCADAAGDAGAALLHAQILRRLGHAAPPPGLDAAVWSRYPPIDAAGNVARAEVEVSSDVEGSQVWVDYQRRGPAPATLYLEQGEHVVAVAAGDKVAARRFSISGWKHAESLSPELARGRWSRLDDQVDALRAAKRPADADGIGAVLHLAGARFALVLAGGGLIEVWAARPGGAAELLGRRRSPEQAAHMLADAAHPARAPDPDRPLLRETEAERQAREEAKSEKTKWWVYAAVIGAAVVGGGIIILGDSGEDRQRFEITLP